MRRAELYCRYVSFAEATVGGKVDARQADDGEKSRVSHKQGWNRAI